MLWLYLPIYSKHCEQINTYPSRSLPLALASQRVQSVCTNKDGVNLDILNKIADIFQVDADYLLGRSSLSHEPEPVTIAAHLDTSDLTQAELDDVEKYIQFIRSKRKQ